MHLALSATAVSPKSELSERKNKQDFRVPFPNRSASLNKSSQVPSRATHVNPLTPTILRKKNAKKKEAKKRRIVTKEVFANKLL